MAPFVHGGGTCPDVSLVSFCWTAPSGPQIGCQRACSAVTAIWLYFAVIAGKMQLVTTHDSCYIDIPSLGERERKKINT